MFQLVTNVPLMEVMSPIEQDLLNDDSSLVYNVEMRNLLEVYLEQNSSAFNKQMFMQLDGLIMGCPLSPLLDDLFMHKLVSEKNVTGD